ncbi:hypothetical protein INT47_010265 [Mucor saturninus]|uniref:DDE Tnp4 domain-containing protein n=1 Tax=Mucor saturninus TaxID=64648 RepID=A0A8H7QFT2_9FUNG|nr:hypothetical protein INT47_010265 [Mucor saturninus]
MPSSKNQRFNLITTAAFSAAVIYHLYHLELNYRIADQTYINSRSLRRPSESAATALINGRDHKSFLCHLGLTVEAFENLYGEFKLHYPQECPTGRPRVLDAKMVLALVLMWLHNTMKQETLSMIFGVPAATVIRSNNMGIETFLKMFKSKPKDPRSKIGWPSSSEKAEFNEMVLSNTTNDFERGVLTGIFGFVDGLNLRIQHPEDSLKQNAYYNGCKGDCFASQVIVFTPDGCICYVRYNYSGSWHDAQIFIPLYRDLLARHCPEPFKILADSAFPCKREFASKVLSVPKENAIGLNRADRETQKKHAVITKHRQAVEWGMRCLQQSFGRLHMKLPSHKPERNDMLIVVWRLHNFRTRLVGINQIRTVYYGTWNYRRNVLENRVRFN